MTEAGQKWVEEHWVVGATEGTKGVLFPGAEFWVRAFCAEVEKRAEIENKRLEGRQNYNDLIADAFQFIKQELLGGRDAATTQ